MSWKKSDSIPETEPFPILSDFVDDDARFIFKFIVIYDNI